MGGVLEKVIKDEQPATKILDFASAPANSLPLEKNICRSGIS